MSLNETNAPFVVERRGLKTNCGCKQSHGGGWERAAGRTCWRSHASNDDSFYLDIFRSRFFEIIMTVDLFTFFHVVGEVVMAENEDEGSWMQRGLEPTPYSQQAASDIRRGGSILPDQTLDWPR
eukprot:scaffold203958_cov52-Attheya_sp.AAC.1